MYKFGDVQTRDVQNLKMYNHVLPDAQPRATECKKKSLSKPINMGSSFENLDARSSKVKTVRIGLAVFKIFRFEISVLKNKREN